MAHASRLRQRHDSVVWTLTQKTLVLVVLLFPEGSSACNASVIIEQPFVAFHPISHRTNPVFVTVQQQCNNSAFITNNTAGMPMEYYFIPTIALNGNGSAVSFQLSCCPGLYLAPTVGGRVGAVNASFVSPNDVSWFVVPGRSDPTQYSFRSMTTTQYSMWYMSVSCNLTGSCALTQNFANLAVIKFPVGAYATWNMHSAQVLSSYPPTVLQPSSFFDNGCGNTASATTCDQSAALIGEARAICNGGNCLRHCNLFGHMSNYISTESLQDYDTRIVPALNGVPGAVSFEMTNEPGYYYTPIPAGFLNTAYESGRVYGKQNLSPNDASFLVVPGLSDPSQFSFVSMSCTWNGWYLSRDAKLNGICVTLSNFYGDVRLMQNPPPENATWSVSTGYPGAMANIANVPCSTSPTPTTSLTASVTPTTSVTSSVTPTTSLTSSLTPSISWSSSSTPSTSSSSSGSRTATISRTNTASRTSSASIRSTRSHSAVSVSASSSRVPTPSVDPSSSATASSTASVSGEASVSPEVPLSLSVVMSPTMSPGADQTTTTPEQIVGAPSGFTDAPPALSNLALVGVAVAAGVGALVLLALVFIVVWRRKRRQVATPPKEFPGKRPGTDFARVSVGSLISSRSDVQQIDFL